VPSLLRRSVLSYLYSFEPLLTSKFSSALHKASSNYLASSIELDRIQDIVNFVLDLAKRLNVALFYFSGIYYNLFNRLLSIRYLSATKHHSLTTSNSELFKLLGYLSLLQIVLSLYVKYSLVVDKSKAS